MVYLCVKSTLSEMLSVCGNDMGARSGSTPVATGCNARPMHRKLGLKVPVERSYSLLLMKLGARPGSIPLSRGCKARRMHPKLGLKLPDRMEKEHRHNTKLTSNTLTKTKGEGRQEARCPRS